MHTINLAPIFQQILNPLIEMVLQGLAIAIVGWITWVAQKYAPQFLKGYLESKASKDLNTALANGVAAAMNTVENAEKVHSDIQVKSAVQAFAIQYAADHAAGAINHFDLSPDQLALKALAFIPTPPIQLASPMPVSATITETTLADIPGAKTE